MHIHILGICGTFMGSLAQLAREAGHRVTGADANVYPPMSTQLEAAGIELIEGFHPSQLDLTPDMIVVGNVVSRGNPLMEEILDRGIAFTSGPQWLADHILRGKWVLGVSGTHGKTTTSSMLAWILEYAGMSPGYLIGGVPGNFSSSARMGNTDFFVIEADEYDTAFFDKRSKFVHYRPRTLVINNLEFDHADIFEDLAAIQKQFHHVVRCIPRNGLVVYKNQASIKKVIEQGCWSSRQCLGGVNIADVDKTEHAADKVTLSDELWNYTSRSQDNSHFDILLQDKVVASVDWQLNGLHNVFNAIAAIAAARHVGVLPELAGEALKHFRGVKRRMELIGDIAGVKLYDDFAHHPTAIATTLEGLRSKVGRERIIAIIEPRSNTMKRGVHKAGLLDSIAAANEVFWYQDQQLDWSLEEYVSVNDAANGNTFNNETFNSETLKKSQVCLSVDDIIDLVIEAIDGKPCHIVIMSNGGFQGIHTRMLTALTDKLERGKADL
ncbi:UDP-N-acetylmuramate:L-alanyl-gamma-D-glutamyl-meso-diaminopimelate ligase [Agarilytica rhodophyticola]|uniref:UDP-N-acetylmuramate:L-alanyl-gamma-D-glutamyl- meso-diaminopimelate ligase n=1 Tax=Agarilytica rhodophyticola TaxID=1737490 RepID=UPI000B343D67|nr:UDP-N-acetylmuramate:L-alanyl-gamma-D-glutamyl-meso-diaminopimelate ligase [Agarilytica rhodophyticola]